MADVQTLKTFEIRPTDDGEGAELHIAGESGDEIVVAATRAQLDVIADELDAMLDETEAQDSV